MKLAGLITLIVLILAHLGIGYWEIETHSMVSQYLLIGIELTLGCIAIVLGAFMVKHIFGNNNEK